MEADRRHAALLGRFLGGLPEPACAPVHPSPSRGLGVARSWAPPAGCWPRVVEGAESQGCGAPPGPRVAGAALSHLAFQCVTRQSL